MQITKNVLSFDMELTAIMSWFHTQWPPGRANFIYMCSPLVLWTCWYFSSCLISGHPLHCRSISIVPVQSERLFWICRGTFQALKSTASQNKLSKLSNISHLTSGNGNQTRYIKLSYFFAWQFQRPSAFCSKESVLTFASNHIFTSILGKKLCQSENNQSHADM